MYMHVFHVSFADMHLLLEEESDEQFEDALSQPEEQTTQQIGILETLKDVCTGDMPIAV